MTLRRYRLLAWLLLVAVLALLASGVALVELVYASAAGP